MLYIFVSYHLDIRDIIVTSSVLEIFHKKLAINYTYVTASYGHMEKLNQKVKSSLY
jgi:hypothetical protein